jgi:fatty acid desaturase 2 (delta-6 desaturase)
VWRIVECCLFWLIGAWLLSSNSIFAKALGCACIGMAGGRAGWLQHEGGHHSLTGVPDWDRALDSVILGIFGGLSGQSYLSGLSLSGLGLSGQWYKTNHNIHHAFPNVPFLFHT